MKLRMVMILLLGALLPAMPAAAKGLTPGVIPPLAASGELKPGTWVRYSMLIRKSRALVKVRLAALAREGKDQWFELSLTDQARRTLTFKVLVEGGLTKPKSFKKVIVQPHGQRPLLLPPGLVKNPLPSFTTAPGPKTKGGRREKIKVAGGTFTARRYRTGKGDNLSEAWLSSEVPGWPMIKSITPRVLLELSGYGDKASSKVNGKPLKMDENLVKALGIQLP